MRPFMVRTVIVAAILSASIAVLYIATGEEILSGALRFLWGGFVGFVTVVTRAFEGSIAGSALAILRRRAVKIAGALGAVGLGYGTSVLLRRTHVDRAYSLRVRFRAFRVRMAESWRQLSITAKCCAVVAIISMQFLLLPAIAHYIVFFPIGFLIPIVRRLGVMVADSTIAVLYWRFCGRLHTAIARNLHTLGVFQALADGIAGARMRYLTAWRLWKHDPQYRKENGELWISCIEPFRLWRSGTLSNHYRKRKLLAGKNKKAVPFQ